MNATIFRPPEPFTYGSLQEMITNWKSWKREFLEFMDATENNVKRDNVKVSMLLNLAGSQGRELYDTFSWTEPDDKLEFSKVLHKVDSRMSQNKNITVNRFEFFLAFEH